MDAHKYAGLKPIPLTRGYVAYVDPEDFDHLNRWKWKAFFGKNGVIYAIRSVGRNGTAYMHREITQAAKGMMVDHIDHDGLNNSRNNLRVCSNGQNCMNARKRRKASSVFKGVHLRKKTKWMARIQRGELKVNIGGFNTEQTAADAYDFAACCYHGEFAHPNNPNMKPEPDHGLTDDQVKLGAQLFALTNAALRDMGK